MIKNWPCVLLTCPIGCTVFNTTDSLMFARFSLGEFREALESVQLIIYEHSIHATLNVILAYMDQCHGMYYYVLRSISYRTKNNQVHQSAATFGK